MPPPQSIPGRPGDNPAAPLHHDGVGGGPGAGGGTPAHQGGSDGGGSPGQDLGTPPVPHLAIRCSWPGG